MISLRQLESFVRVAEVGSFSKAALLLGVAQPALSRQVRQLELELRCSLLERTGRGVVPTVAGRRVLEHAPGLLEGAQRLREAAAGSRDEPAGRIVVGLPPSLGRSFSVALVESFAAAFPRARLAIVEGLSAHIGEWIASGRVDLGFLYNPEPQAAIETEPVLAEALHLIGPPGSPCTPVTLRDLPRHPLVIPERTHAIRRLLEVRVAQAGLQLDIAWEVSGVPAILALVRSGHGYAVLGRSAVREGDGAGLSARPIEDGAPLLNTLFLAASATRPPTALQRLLRPRLRALALRLEAGVDPGAG